MKAQKGNRGIALLFL